MIRYVYREGGATKIRTETDGILYFRTASIGGQIALYGVEMLQDTRIFAALDADKAGSLNATRLAALSVRVTLVRVPEGNDVTEYCQAGGDVRAWVMAVMGDDTRFPLRVVIPPDEAMSPGLAVPAGRWQRMDDGSIVVVYASAEEMAVCREATRVCEGKVNFVVMTEVLVRPGSSDRWCCIRACRLAGYLGGQDRQPALNVTGPV